MIYKLKPTVPWYRSIFLFDEIGGLEFKQLSEKKKLLYEAVPEPVYGSYIWPLTERPVKKIYTNTPVVSEEKSTSTIESTLLNVGLDLLLSSNGNDNSNNSTDSGSSFDGFGGGKFSGGGADGDF